MMRSLVSRAWFAVLAAALLLPVAIALGQPLRAIATVALFCLLPGMSLTYWLHISQTLLRVVMAVALSLSLTALVSTALFFLHQWTWQRCVAILVGVIVAATLPRLAPRWRERRPV
jgi:glucose-6-phosphate-specific signal transduction histidine kinase